MITENLENFTRDAEVTREAVPFVDDIAYLEQPIAPSRQHVGVPDVPKEQPNGGEATIRENRFDDDAIEQSDDDSGELHVRRDNLKTYPARWADVIRIGRQPPRIVKRPERMFEKGVIHPPGQTPSPPKIIFHPWDLQRANELWDEFVTANPEDFKNVQNTERGFFKSGGLGSRLETRKRKSREVPESRSVAANDRSTKRSRLEDRTENSNERETMGRSEVRELSPVASGSRSVSENDRRPKRVGFAERMRRRNSDAASPCDRDPKKNRFESPITEKPDFMADARSRLESQRAVENSMQRARRASASEKAKELELINGLVCGKNVLITGGAMGLGYAFVNHFLQHGVRKVTILDVDSEAADRAVKAAEKNYGDGKVTFVLADTSNRQETVEAFAKAAESMESIDIVINNAGVLDERRWEREISVNIGGMMNVASVAMYYMGKDQAGNGGVLVNIAQYVDYRWTAQLAVYTATKHAIIGLSQSLGAPYHSKKTGVRVMTLCPGLTETALTINSPNRLLSRVMKADFVKNLEQLPIQTPYVVAQGLMSILKSGSSGSVWVVENGRAPFEVYTPTYRSLRRCYRNNFVIVETAKVTRGRPIREVCDNTRTGLMSCA